MGEFLMQIAGAVTIERTVVMAALTEWAAIVYYVTTRPF